MIRICGDCGMQYDTVMYWHCPNFYLTHSKGSKMNVTEIVSGSNGFEAAGFVKSVFANQLGFFLQRAAFQKEQGNEVPVADAAEAAELRAAMGDNGLAERQVFDMDELVTANAAAYILLTRHCNTPNPENGRKPEHLVRYLKTPAMVVQAGIDYRLERQILQTRAAAELFKADPSKRIEVITTELKAQAATLTAPINKAFVEAIKLQSDDENSDLVDTCLEALVNCGREPSKEVKQAAIALIASQKKRFEAGDFAMVDAGIYALAGLDVSPKLAADIKTVQDSVARGAAHVA